MFSISLLLYNFLLPICGEFGKQKDSKFELYSNNVRMLADMSVKSGNFHRSVRANGSAMDQFWTKLNWKKVKLNKFYKSLNASQYFKHCQTKYIKVANMTWSDHHDISINTVRCENIIVKILKILKYIEIYWNVHLEWQFICSG